MNEVAQMDEKYRKMLKVLFVDNLRKCSESGFSPDSPKPDSPKPVSPKPETPTLTLNPNP